MRQIAIRQAERQDVADIQFVAQQSWSEVYQGIIPADIQQMALEAWYSAGSLLETIETSGSTFLVAESARAQVLGFAQLVVQGTASAQLTRIYVLPGSQRHGIGTQLLEELLARAREVGVCEVIVAVEQRNGKGRAFYERSGFRESTESAVDICGFSVPIIVYRLRVPGGAA